MSNYISKSNLSLCLCLRLIVLYFYDFISMIYYFVSVTIAKLYRYKRKYTKLNCQLLIIFSNSLDLDQARRIVCPDQGPNCLTF